MGLVLLWRLAHHDACHLPMVTSATNGDQRTMCFEFWLYRYQTLIAGLFAVGAAYVAWIAAKDNISAISESVDISKRQFAAAAIEHLNARMQLLYKIRQEAMNCHIMITSGRYDVKAQFDLIMSEIDPNEKNKLDLMQRIDLIHSYANDLLTQKRNSVAPAIEAIKRSLETQTLTKKCRIALAKQYWRGNSTLGAMQLVIISLINYRDDISGGNFTHRQLKEFSDNIEAVMSKFNTQDYAECEKIIDEEIAVVTNLIDKTLGELEHKQP